MSQYPPFMNSYGSVTKVLEKVISAKRPDRFTQDFLETVLGFTSSSTRPVISLLKRIGFLNSDGSPTDLYARFKTEGGRRNAMASGIRMGYAQLFDKNEYVYRLDKAKLTDLLVELTGDERDNPSLKAVVGTFFALTAFADFETSGAPNEIPVMGSGALPAKPEEQESDTGFRSVGFGLSYTINLNLPETTNVEVFNAIFRSLKENLLK